MRLPKWRFTLPLEIQTEVRRLFDEDYYLSRYPDEVDPIRGTTDRWN